MTPKTLPESSELLLLPDGRILAHNITPRMAALLAELDPNNLELKQRAGQGMVTERDAAPKAAAPTDGKK